MTLGSLFDGNYTIYRDGRLYSERSNKFLRPSEDKYGYLYYVVSICGHRRTVKAHRAVAMAYIENPMNKPTVDHINGDRKDNRVDNLRWATYAEQQSNPVTAEKAKMLHDKTDYQAMGAIRNFGRKRVKAFKDGVFIGRYDSLKLAAETLDICYSKASMCASGQRKQVGGYSLQYGD